MNAEYNRRLHTGHVVCSDIVRRLVAHCFAVVVILVVIACAALQSASAQAVPSESSAVSPPHTVIPIPASVDLSTADTFTVTAFTQIVVDAGDAEGERIGRFLADLIGNTVATTPPVVEAGAEDVGPHIRLTRQGADAGMGAEAYDLVITSEDVTLTAAEPAGLFYGVQTIRQLLPSYVEYSAAYVLPMWMPAGHIADEPRFAWRGAMLDPSRHFIPPADVKRFIDLMALYKLNGLHIHLSDDQGWRIEIPGRPRLTEHGASTEVGGGPGGYYSTAEWSDLVSYAQERFITIVPEIDMPGHTNAALASYPEITCDGEAPDLYTGTEVGFSFMCVEKEETYEFIDDVVREIAAITPGPYFHLGGDEVHQLTEEQYVTFMERAQEIVAEHGKRVVGWDEIAEVDLNLLPGTVIQVWRPQTPATSEAVAAAVADGASIIASPADHIYLDMKYDSTTVLGLAWAGYNDVRDAYDWDPADLVPGVSEEGILGVEAPHWSESLASISDLEYMAFPRLAGVAEIGWSPAADRSWDEYRLRLGGHGPRWTALGVNFYRAPEIPWQSLTN